MTAAPVSGAVAYGSYTSLTGPTVTFTGYVPVENDIVIVQVHCTNTAASGTGITDGTWVDSGNGLRNNTDNSMATVMILHLVTAAEQTAGTNSWNLAGLFAGGETGVYHGMVVRGGDPADFIDGFGLAFDAEEPPTTTRLAGIPGAGLSADSLVVSCIQADNPSRTFTTPSGFTQLSGGAGGWIGIRNTPTAAGVDVPNTTIAMDVPDQTMSFSIAIKAAPTGGNTPPVANAGADQTNLEPFATATLNGTASSDTDGTIGTYEWTQIDGPTVSLINSNTATCTYVVPATHGDTATFRLTVTDDDADTHTDDVTHEWLPHTWWLVSGGTASIPVRSTIIS